jgi:hypothetical protein
LQLADMLVFIHESILQPDDLLLQGLQQTAALWTDHGAVLARHMETEDARVFLLWVTAWVGDCRSGRIQQTQRDEESAKNTSHCYSTSSFVETTGSECRLLQV